MSFITPEKSELIAKFEKLLEGVENKSVLAPLLAQIAIEYADTKVKRIASNLRVSGCICEFIKSDKRCRKKAKYEMVIYTPKFPDISGDVIVNMCEEHGKSFLKYMGTYLRKYPANLMTKGFKIDYRTSFGKWVKANFNAQSNGIFIRKGKMSEAKMINMLTVKELKRLYNMVDVDKNF